MADSAQMDVDEPQQQLQTAPSAAVDAPTASPSSSLPPPSTALETASTSVADSATANGAPEASTSTAKRPLSPQPEATRSTAAEESTQGTKKDAAEPVKKKAKKDNGLPKLYCHQDHQAHDLTTTTFLHCTAQKPTGKAKTLKQCGGKYCERCLSNRYGEDAAAINASGASSTWTCPSCRGICNCSSCRKKQGLEATGVLKGLVQENGASSAADLLSVMPSARSAAKKANAAMSASFTAGGLPAAQSLTRSSPPAPKKVKVEKQKKAKKPKKEKTDGNGSDSSLSSLTDSDSDREAAGPSKPKASKASKAAKGPKPKADSPSVDGKAGSSAPRRTNQPRIPTKLAPPPPSHALSSAYYPHSVLPTTSSILARLHFREFLLRFLRLIPSLRPGKKTPTAQQARVLSSLADDILWLWSDNDLAAETVQLVLVGGLVELLLREKLMNWTISKEQRIALQAARDEIDAAKKSGSGKVRDKPWETIVEVLEDSEWIGRGHTWRDEWTKLAGVTSEDGGSVKDESEAAGETSDDEPEEEEQQKGEVKKHEEVKASPKPAVNATANGNAASSSKASVNGKSKGKAPAKDADDSDLSSVSSLSEGEGEDDDDNDDDEDSDAYDDRAHVDENEDDSEVDQLASDTDDDEAEFRWAFATKGRRGRFDRQTPAEERLALCCGLIDLTFKTELMRNEINMGLDIGETQRKELNRKKFQLKKDLVDEIDRLRKSKPDKPPGNGSSERVKEWEEECFTIEQEIKEAEVKNTKDGWRIQHDMYLNQTLHQNRFSEIGTDALYNKYYLLSPPPSELLENPTGRASSGLPLHFTSNDHGKKDYPLSYAVLVHGRRPVSSASSPSSADLAAAATSSPQRAAKGNAEKKLAAGRDSAEDDGKPDPSAFERHIAQGKDEWWVVTGVDDIDALAAWVDGTLRSATYLRDVAQHYTDHPPGKENTSHKTKAQLAAIQNLVPTKKELEEKIERIEKTTSDLGDVLRQFAVYVRWVREKATVDGTAVGTTRRLRGMSE
ncbi:hypothetical protein JCM8547_003631 [Rhodosporidiobolus lusitaniae]